MDGLLKHLNLHGHLIDKYISELEGQVSALSKQLAAANAELAELRKNPNGKTARGCGTEDDAGLEPAAERVGGL